ncbi:preprotein translocase subunit SecG [Dongia sp.]|jgi:preprotein translocase subunit SecG|uniref:preprotein translocase subunit SecG n=1 Tax=Dongia sp. TaxID=1977262 RepID=UPI0034A0F7B3
MSMLGALFPIVLAIHVIITVFLIGIILTQKNEGGMGGLGGGASGGMAGFLSGRAQANLLTKATRWLAVGFFCTSLFLAFSDSHRGASQPIVGSTPAAETAPAAPAGDAPAGAVPAGDSGNVEATTPVQPAVPVEPAAPSGQ